MADYLLLVALALAMIIFAVVRIRLRRRRMAAARKTFGIRQPGPMIVIRNLTIAALGSRDQVIHD